LGKDAIIGKIRFFVTRALAHVHLVLCGSLLHYVRKRSGPMSKKLHRLLLRFSLTPKNEPLTASDISAWVAASAWSNTITSHERPGQCNEHCSCAAAAANL
jgi:hypothetical protein